MSVSGGDLISRGGLPDPLGGRRMTFPFDFETAWLVSSACLFLISLIAIFQVHKNERKHVLRNSFRHLLKKHLPTDSDVIEKELADITFEAIFKGNVSYLRTI